MRLCVASGVGITPFLSVMATKVEEESTYEDDQEVFGALFDERMENRNTSSSTFDAVKKSAVHALGSVFSIHSSDKSGKTVQLDMSETEKTSGMFVKATEVKPLHIVWSIRNVAEVTFYMEYIVELVKSQHHLETVVVHVHIYLTGLGKEVDPGYMLAQTLFLLALSENSSKWLQIYFGRPDLDKIISGLDPNHVYYCGGGILKSILHTICYEKNIPYHPEDFDSGANTLPDFQRSVLSALGVAPAKKRR